MMRHVFFVESCVISVIMTHHDVIITEKLENQTPSITVAPELDENEEPLANSDDFKREEHFQKIAQEGARRGVIKAKRAGLPLLRPNG